MYVVYMCNPGQPYTCMMDCVKVEHAYLLYME